MPASRLRRAAVLTAAIGALLSSPAAAFASSAGLVEDINSNGSDSSSPNNLANVGGTLFFQAYEGTHGEELWMSDGNEAGTELVEDIDPNGSDGSGLGSLTSVGGTLFFEANDGTHGYELCKASP